MEPNCRKRKAACISDVENNPDLKFEVWITTGRIQGFGTLCLGRDEVTLHAFYTNAKFVWDYKQIKYFNYVGETFELQIMNQSDAGASGVFTFEGCPGDRMLLEFRRKQSMHEHYPSKLSKECGMNDFPFQDVCFHGIVHHTDTTCNEHSSMVDIIKVVSADKFAVCP
ncbi:hypothetical protein HELRODRAFT_182450 [Helobdella robusta]|uniref:Uncharacterized protein n=1 Tax=Helobdella robusta TaxID=6412 RepID=T1FI77_HELRO|nr:hypothetical protein HELRODRAFT_182450 [Helobdella robusta]ESN90978.1 hypothetical protein HELRODRAFT_182450 [Helobdella robusta]